MMRRMAPTKCSEVWNEEEIALVRDVWEEVGQLDRATLFSLCRDNRSAWSKALGASGIGADIPNELIRAQFLPLLMNEGK